MSDRMTPIPVAPDGVDLDERRRQGRVRRAQAVSPGAARRSSCSAKGSRRRSAPRPVAHAARQNIVAAYVAGARFFELKTVQTLDGEDLPVSKPCILAEDEGYNVEWSTELRVHRRLPNTSRLVYAQLIAKEFGLATRTAFVFNIASAYNFDGITSKKIDDFIEGLKNAEGHAGLGRVRALAKANLSRFTAVDEGTSTGISPAVCTSVTLSTLHGCRRRRSSASAVSAGQKRLHTFVKCNPTLLLGYDFCRARSTASLRRLAFDEFHFGTIAV